MKGSSIFLVIVLLAVIEAMGYYNFEQKKTIELLNQEILEQSDQILEIPMMGQKESMNVSVSTGIALYRLRN